MRVEIIESGCEGEPLHASDGTPADVYCSRSSRHRPPAARLDPPANRFGWIREPRGIVTLD